MGQTQAQLQTRTQAQFRARRKYVIKSVARVFGIPASTLSYRMKRHGISVVQAAVRPHQVGRKARAAGMNPSTVRNRIRKKGWTLKEALAAPVAPRGPTTLTQRARAAGLSPSTVSRRVLYIGMTLDEAIAAGKDMRTRDDKGWFIPNQNVSGETRSKAARSYAAEKTRLRCRRYPKRRKISAASRIWDEGFRLTSVPADDTEWMRQVPRARDTMADENVAFVMALPGWDVLYYFHGGRFETAPIVAWGVTAQDGVFVRATPVTSDLAWSYDDERTICTPDGDVTCGDLERWDTIWLWLDEMKRRESQDPDRLPPERPVPQAPHRKVLALDNFRHKLQQGDAP